MGRPVITRAIKRARHFLAGRVEDYAAAGLESIGVEDAHELVKRAEARIAERIAKRKAKRKAKKAPAEA